MASGNGDSSDATNIDKTFLRGLQPTEFDGVAQFTTTFPGHYTSRATHIHVIANFNGTILANSTYSGGAASHVGQIFFDQDLITQVEATAPYNTNTQEITENAVDTIFSEEAGTIDPVAQYSLLGETVEDGIFAWISFGIDLTQSQTITPAATLTENGGVANEDSGSMGGGSGGPDGSNSTESGSAAGFGSPPSSSASTGAALSGFVTSSTAVSESAAVTSSTAVSASAAVASNDATKNNAKNNAKNDAAKNDDAKNNAVKNNAAKNNAAKNNAA